VHCAGLIRTLDSGSELGFGNLGKLGGTSDEQQKRANRFVFGFCYCGKLRLLDTVIN
jgi:hypothetical protein